MPSVADAREIASGINDQMESIPQALVDGRTGVDSVRWAAGHFRGIVNDFRKHAQQNYQV